MCGEWYAADGRRSIGSQGRVVAALLIVRVADFTASSVETSLRVEADGSPIGRCGAKGVHPFGFRFYSTDCMAEVRLRAYNGRSCWGETRWHVTEKLRGRVWRRRCGARKRGR